MSLIDFFRDEVRSSIDRVRIWTNVEHEQYCASRQTCKVGQGLQLSLQASSPQNNASKFKETEIKSVEREGREEGEYIHPSTWRLRCGPKALTAPHEAMSRYHCEA